MQALKGSELASADNKRHSTTSQGVPKPARLRSLGSQLKISDPTAETHRHSGHGGLCLCPKRRPFTTKASRTHPLTTDAVTFAALLTLLSIMDTPLRSSKFIHIPDFCRKSKCGSRNDRWEFVRHAPRDTVITGNTTVLTILALVCSVAADASDPLVRVLVRASARSVTTTTT